MQHWWENYTPLVDPVEVPFNYNDGGRVESGYGKTGVGDCVTRSIAIGTQKPYDEVYGAMWSGLKEHARTKRDRVAKNIKRKGGRRGTTPRNGIHRKVYDKYLKSLGWTWVPCMLIGKGCKVHLRPDELPMGRLIVRVSKHVTTMIDGVLNDTYDCSRKGQRCVYGYYIKK